MVRKIDRYIRVWFKYSLACHQVRTEFCKQLVDLGAEPKQKEERRWLYEELPARPIIIGRARKAGGG